jgi:hypothetical protein
VIEHTTANRRQVETHGRCPIVMPSAGPASTPRMALAWLRHPALQTRREQSNYGERSWVCQSQSASMTTFVPSWKLRRRPMVSGWPRCYVTSPPVLPVMRNGHASIRPARPLAVGSPATPKHALSTRRSARRPPMPAEPDVTPLRAGQIVLADWRSDALPKEPNKLRPAAAVVDDRLFALNDCRSPGMPTPLEMAECPLPFSLSQGIRAGGTESKFSAGGTRPETPVPVHSSLSLNTEKTKDHEVPRSPDHAGLSGPDEPQAACSRRYGSSNRRSCDRRMENRSRSSPRSAFASIASRPRV